MPRRAFSSAERIDEGWDVLTSSLAHSINVLRDDESRFVVPLRKPTWRVRLLRRGHTLGAEVRRLSRHSIPGDVQAGLLELGWGVRTSPRDEEPGFAVLWEPHQLTRPTLRQRITGRSTPDWITPDDVVDAAEFLVATLRGPLQVLGSGEIVIR